MYLIWYGTWSGSNSTAILEHFLAHLGGSSYYNIATSYYDKLHQHVSNSLVYGGSILDAYSSGQTLTSRAIFGIVQRVRACTCGARYEACAHVLVTDASELMLHQTNTPYPQDALL